MSKHTINWLILLMSLISISCFAWTPTFSNGDTLKIDSKIPGIDDTLMFSSPEFADWDEDGKTDLLIGYWGMWTTGPNTAGGYGGRIRFYKNNGTNSNPDYEDRGDLLAEGDTIDLHAA